MRKIEKEERKQMMELAGRLKFYRETEGISQLTMARKLGLKSQQTLAFIEKNGLSLAKAIGFEKKLGVSFINEQLGITPVPAVQNKGLDKIEATLKVLVHRLAKIDSRASGRSVAECVKDIEDDITLVMR